MDYSTHWILSSVHALSLHSPDLIPVPGDPTCTSYWHYQWILHNYLSHRHFKYEGPCRGSAGVCNTKIGYPKDMLRLIMRYWIHNTNPYSLTIIKWAFIDYVTQHDFLSQNFCTKWSLWTGHNLGKRRSSWGPSTSITLKSENTETVLVTMPMEVSKGMDFQQPAEETVCITGFKRKRRAKRSNLR